MIARVLTANSTTAVRTINNGACIATSNGTPEAYATKLRGSDEPALNALRAKERARATEHSAGSKAQWEKTKPKSRCQCHACGEREGEG
jgi:hypothetical protein